MGHLDRVLMLHLKVNCIRLNCFVDLPKLNDLSFGDMVCSGCFHAVFESEECKHELICRFA